MPGVGSAAEGLIIKTDRSLKGNIEQMVLFFNHFLQTNRSQNLFRYFNDRYRSRKAAVIRMQEARGMIR